jgi:hypothetical protein
LCANIFLTLQEIDFVFDKKFKSKLFFSTKKTIFFNPTPKKLPVSSDGQSQPVAPHVRP